MVSYICKVKSIGDLSRSESERMLGLYESLYVLHNKKIFWEDLAEKKEVLLLWAGEDLVGFTTVQVYGFEFLGVARRIVFSGDTIVHRDHWGQQVLASHWIRRVGEFHQEDPTLSTYWFLVVKGHRTYRFLPAFCTRFHPHWEHPEPALKALADALAFDRFGEHYDAESGLVRYSASRGHLREVIAHPSERELRRPSVAYFLERNPGYLQGHELVCLFEFTEEAMKPLTRRLFLGRT